MRWLYHIPIVLSAIILFAGEDSLAQNSLIQRYTQLTADSVLIVAPFPSLTDSGYVVKDMQLVGNVCWFAGYKWKDTGEPYYLPGGGVTTLVTYKAFVGKYNVTDVLNGSGNYGIIEIDALHHIERLAVVDKNVTAIGVTSSGERRLVELARKTILTMEYYTLKIEESSSPHEVFMDVVAAGNKVVVLSRFKNTWGFIRSTYWFGLRYGDAGNMQTTTSPVRIYDVYDALDWRLGFPSVHPVRLAATGNGNGVVMAYIAQRNDNPNTLLGKYVLFHIASENASTADVFINMSDNLQYTELADIRFNTPVTNNTYMALLLRDADGNSVLRFPLLNIPYSMSEKVFSIDNPRVESLAPYQTGSNGLELAAAGRFLGNTPNPGQITQKGIYSTISNSCLTLGTGYINLIDNAQCKEEDENFTLSVVPATSQMVVFKNHSYTATNASRTTTCSTGNQ